MKRIAIAVIMVMLLVGCSTKITPTDEFLNGIKEIVVLVENIKAKIESAPDIVAETKAQIIKTFDDVMAGNITVPQAKAKFQELWDSIETNGLSIWDDLKAIYAKMQELYRKLLALQDESTTAQFWLGLIEKALTVFANM